jgi:hypothetical protein
MSPACHLLRLYAKTIQITFEGDEPVMNCLRVDNRRVQSMADILMVPPLPRMS